MRPAVYEWMRRELIDAGELIATYEYFERAGNRVIAEIDLHAPAERAAPVFARAFPGAQLIEESIPEASALAVADEQVVGVILVDSQRLILTVFRDPAHPGTGAALIRHALNSGPLTLVVTHGNPAERLDRRLGFQHAYEAYSVDL